MSNHAEEEMMGSCKEDTDPDSMVGEEVEPDHDLNVDEFEMEDEDDG